MLDITSFDAVFSFDRQAEYSKERLQAINKSRNKLPRLFIERLLLTLDLEHVATLYPPRANKGLREFHHEIVNSNIATHHKQALLYYVLNDLQPPEDETDRFANEVDLPKAYKFAMLGFWEMDRLEFRSALDHLTQPSLLPSFSSEILSVLLTHSKDPNLPLAYYHSVSPPIPVGSEVREHYFQFLASLSVTQAFFFSRSQPDRRQLFESLVSIGLHEKRKPDQGDQALALIDLPLDAEEEAWWKEFLTKKGERKGKDKKEAELARAMLYMRSITTGRGSDLLGVEGSLGGKRIGGVDWDTIRSGIAKATGPRSGMLGAK